MVDTQEDTPLKLLGYNRVSTAGQADEGFNLKEYDKKIRAMCDLRDWEILEIHTDEGKSATKEEGRPAYLKMMKRFRTDPTVDGIIVYKLDRLHRNLQNALRFFEELQELGKTFISVVDNIDTSTAMGRAMLQITLVFAELESAQIAERVHIGRQASIEAGFHQSSINPKFWYIDRDDPRAEEAGGSGLVKPTDLLLEIAVERRENRLSYWNLHRKFGSNPQAFRSNLAKLKRWEEDPVFGFILSKTSHIIVPRVPKQPLSKKQKDRRDKAALVVLRDKKNFQDTGKYLYPDIRALANACGVHFSTIYGWHYKKILDLSYRIG